MCVDLVFRKLGINPVSDFVVVFVLLFVLGFLFCFCGMKIYFFCFSCRTDSKQFKIRQFKECLVKKNILKSK